MSKLSGTRLFFLSLGGEKADPSQPHGAVLSCNTDGSDLRTLVSRLGTHPDGVQFDNASKHIYYTNMGVHPDHNDGFISRVDLDGSNDITVVQPGVAGFTPKQCSLDQSNRVLYWCDREGMRIWRARLPAPASSSNNTEYLKPELLYQSAEGDAARQDLTNHCVGIAVDSANLRIYWTQKGPSKGGVGRLFTAGTDIPAGETPNQRSDVVCLLDHLPEPIDLEIDHTRGVLYKTDRGAEPRGNTVSRIDLSLFAGEKGVGAAVRSAASDRKLQEQVLATHLHEAIGLALDVEQQRMFFTDLGGSVYSANLDGSDKREILKGVGDLTGICLVHLD